MDSRKIEILQDLEEFKNLIESSERPAIRTVLFNQIKSLATELSSYITPESTPTILYKNIDKWAWDQDKKYVRVYITSLPSLKSHPKSNILHEFTPTSVTVTILDLNGVNYKIRFPRLLKEIKGCRVSAKSNGFSITMEKTSEGDWDTLEWKKSIFTGDEELKDKDNVHEKFFRMMKDIYENGDESMKDQIGVPWMKAMADVYRPISK